MNIDDDFRFRLSTYSETNEEAIENTHHFRESFKCWIQYNIGFWCWQGHSQRT
jgi:hypothetical protein